MQKAMNWFKKNRDKMANIFFYTALSLELLTFVLSNCPFTVPYQGRIPHLAFALFAMKVLFTKYSKKEWIAIVVLGLLGATSYLAMGDEWVIRIVMMIIASKNMSLETSVKCIFWVSFISTGLIVAFACIGIGRPLVDVREYGRGVVETRWCLGFNHANNIHGMIWYIMSLGILVYFQKTKWYHYVLLTIANVGLYLLTVSRAGFLVTEIVIIAALIFRYYPQIAKWKWVYWAGGAGTLFCAGIGIYAIAKGVYGIPWLKKLSDILTGRLEFLTWWEKTEYWTLFGSAREYHAIDDGFITILSKYGYVIFTLYVVCILLLIRYFYSKRKWMEFILLMTCVFYTFMESTFTINTPLLCNFTFVLLIGTWNHLFTKGRQDESVQSKVQIN